MDVRPHHVLVLYTVLTGVASSGIYKKVANVMLSLTARCMNSMIMPLSDKGMVPDFLVRMGIRLQLRDQLQQAVPVSAADAMDAKMSVLHQLSGSSGENADAESAGIVELPAAIYGMCLGPSKKYSAGLWTDKSTTLAESETNMLKLYCERAGVKDGMKIVDLGCGVGSLSLYIAEKYPHCQITGISNNNAHRRSILKTAAAKNLSNVRVLTVRASNLIEKTGYETVAHAVAPFRRYALCACIFRRSLV